MDISDITLVAMGSALVVGSSLVIFCLNYRNICGCCIRTPPPIDDSINPVNPIQSIHAWK
jgi:hypothetical protein